MMNRLVGAACVIMATNVLSLVVLIPVPLNVLLTVGDSRCCHTLPDVSGVSNGVSRSGRLLQLSRTSDEGR